MKPVFDYEKLKALLEDFYKLTQIRITVFDSELRELIYVPTKLTPLCALLRSSGAEEACHACDRTACAQAVAHSRFGPLTYRCHAGLMESIMPFYVQNTLTGYLILGQTLAYPSHEEAYCEIERLNRHLNIAPERLRAACEQTRLVSEDYFLSAAHILHAVASYLTLEKVATLKEERIATRLDHYIHEHFTETITAQRLCEELKIGKTQLYSLSKQLYGIGIAKKIRSLRIEKARQLLTERPDMSVNAIAEACGFNDYNYFISVFSHLTGESPSRYRRHSISSE